MRKLMVKDLMEYTESNKNRVDEIISGLSKDPKKDPSPGYNYFNLDLAMSSQQIAEARSIAHSQAMSNIYNAPSFYGQLRTGW